MQNLDDMVSHQYAFDNGQPALSNTFYYRQQSSCGKVMFSRVSLILFTREGGVSQHALGQTPAPPRRPLQRTVRILLESILVF